MLKEDDRRVTEGQKENIRELTNILDKLSLY